MTVPVGSGQLYLIDTSAHARVNNPAVRKVIAGLITDRAAATCVTVDLEAGYSGRHVDDIRAIAERRHGLYVVLPISVAPYLNEYRATCRCWHGPCVRGVEG